MLPQLSLMHRIFTKDTKALQFHNKSIFISSPFGWKHFIRGLNAMIKRIAFGHNMQSYTLCCACIFMCICLFSVDGIHVYRCTTHPVSLVGSELRVTVCVCVWLPEWACVCMFIRELEIWDYLGSLKASRWESCCVFSRFSANGVQSGSLLAP